MDTNTLQIFSPTPLFFKTPNNNNREARGKLEGIKMLTTSRSQTMYPVKGASKEPLSGNSKRAMNLRM